MPEAALHQPSLIAAAAFVLILGALLLAGRWRYRAVPALARGARADGAAPPDCMVVIPARNEEASIGRAVSSLPPDTVIMVDDHSSDGTAARAREAGAGVLKAPELPRNAVGKANACAFGAAALTSRWVLFADADTWFEPGFLEAAVSRAEGEGLSLLSIHLDAEHRGFAERVLAPYAQALAFAGLGVSREPNGLFRSQCLLARREPYSFMGGHGAVLTQLAEDVKLTRLAERHRMKLGVVRAAGLGHIRLYEGYRGLRAGIKRQAFRFLSLRSVVGAAIVVAALTAALWLPLIVWLEWGAHWIAAWVVIVAPTALLWPWYRPRAAALLAPLAIYGILPAILGGLWAAGLGRPVRWKGRVIRAVS